MTLTYLKDTNFRWYLISRVKKNYISRVLIFPNKRLQKDLRVLIFANLEFFLLMAYIQSLQVGLVQGGLEVPCKVTVTMSGNVVNHLLLTPYEKLLNELYIEPKNEEIVGTFLSVANEEGKQAEEKSRQQKKQQVKKDVKSSDVRDTLQNPRSKKDGAMKIIVLD